MNQGARDANAESHRAKIRSDQEAASALLESILNEVRKQTKLLERLTGMLDRSG